MRETVCYAYIIVSREPGLLDKEQRLKGLRKVMADTFHQPEEKIEKTLSNLDVTDMTCSKLAAEIKKGCER